MKEKEQEIAGIAKLVDQMKSGDETAFASFYNQTYKYVYSRAKSMFSDEDDAWDLVQEVYLAFYRNVDSIKSSENIFGWLKTTTFYQGTKMLQKRRKEVLLSEDGEGMFESIPDEDQEIEEDYMNKEDVEVIRECIDRLSDEQKTVLLAYYYDNLKVNEISEILSVSEGTIKSRLHLARKNLRSHVEQEEKKRGYKLHSFGPLTLAMAIRAFLQTNMELAGGVEETVFVKVCQSLNLSVSKTIGVQSVVSGEVAKESAKQIGKKLIIKVAEIGAKKVALSVTGIVAASAVAVGAAIGPTIEKPEEPEILPGVIETMQETDADEGVASNTNTNEEEDKKEEPSTPDSTSGEKTQSTSNDKGEEEEPNTSDSVGTEETPSTPDTPNVDEPEEETPSSPSNPSTGTEQEIPGSPSQDPDNNQNRYDGTDTMMPDDSGANGEDTWEGSW